MKHHIKISFEKITHEQKELLLAALSDIGFDGFEEGHDYLVAYALPGDYDELELKNIASDYSVTYNTEQVAEQNWNEQWEQSFQPVVIGNFCAIRASFHPAIAGVQHDIVITPKMSFGTGHHATTHMMVQWMEKIPHRGKTVLDFGTGTGVLAILAEKLGASSIEAIDNDDWSIENARENIIANSCKCINLEKADRLSFYRQFDVILANINKNVLLANMGELQQHLIGEGVLVLSGLLQGDRQSIEASANLHKLKIIGELEKNGWIALQLTHY